AKTGGSITTFGNTISVDGSVGRDILSFNALLNLNGKVAGDVKVKGDTLVIGSTAEVKGRTTFEGKKPAEVSPEAKLGSAVQFEKMESKPSYRTSHYYIWQVIWAGSFILFGLVLCLLMPDFVKQAVASSEQVGASLGLGVLVMFGVPIGAIIACITVVGLF